MFFNNIKNDFCYILATFFGVGFFPKASGTIASIVIALIWYLVPEHVFYNSLDKVIFYDRFLYMFAILILLTYIGAYVSKVSETKFGYDSKVIVFDEIIGYLCAVLFLPKTLMVAIYAFVLFRLFDIMKPLYINKLQSVPKGWGVMLDDVAAGFTANIILQLLFLIRKDFFIII